MFGFKQIQCHGRHVSHPTQIQALWRRLTQMLCSRDFAAEILDAKCEKTDVAEVMKGLIHLDAHQKADLL
jgi:hypothetical protein